MKIKNLFLSILLIILFINGCSNNQLGNIGKNQQYIKGEILFWAEIPVGLNEE